MEFVSKFHLYLVNLQIGYHKSSCSQLLFRIQLRLSFIKIIMYSQFYLYEINDLIINN